MLANIQSYIRYWWQLPMFLGLIVGWLWGGGWLLHRSLKRAGYPKRIAFPRCLLIVFLAGITAIATGGATVLLVRGMFESTDITLTVTGTVVGAIVAAVVMIIVALLVVYAMLEFSFRRSLAASVIPVAAIISLTAVIGSAGLVPAYFLRVRELKRDRCRNANLRLLVVSLQSYQQRHGAPSPTLAALVEQNLIDPNRLRCHGAPEREIGYFYFPLLMAADGPNATRLLLCDYRANHGGGRNVLFANGGIFWYDEEEFQELLQQEENKSFTAALRTAEGP